MDSGKEMPLERLIEVTHQMQDRRLAFADIEGGEPLLKFARLVEYVANIDNRTEVWINTNGYNLTLEKAITLKRVGVFGAMISTHHFLPEKFDQFVGHEGAFDKARQAFALFNQAGIATCMNCCLNQEALRSGGVEKMMDLAREWNCCFVQMIHSKESGGWLDNQEDIINLNNDIDYLKKMHLQYNTDPNYSDYPSVSVQVFEEAKNHYGCTAGGIDRFYLGHSGEVQPCEFLNVSFGNVQEEDFSVIWERMRNHFKKPGVKWLCSEYGPAINKYMKENQITTTPLPREHAEKVVSGWDKGEDTPMYVKMGMYTDGKKS